MNVEEYLNDYKTLEMLEEKMADMPEVAGILKTPIEMISILEFYYEALSYVIHLCPEIKKDWEKIIQLFSQALQDIEEYSNIKYDRSSKVAANVKFPNAWYITPYGILYNTGGKGGHKEGNLFYSYDRIIDAILGDVSLEGIEDIFLMRQLEIVKRGYIEDEEYWWEIKCGFNCDFPEIGYINEYGQEEKFPSRVYDPKVIKIVLGVLSAKAGLYRFFERMQKYTNNPKKELKRLNSMTNGHLADILVRCAGFYKVESSFEKTISTASLTPVEDLIEYLKRGWDVCMIPPIGIDKEKGVLNNVDYYNSLLVARYIEEYIEKYEKDKPKGYGKIYRTNVPK
jgi:endonuclease III-like uncharacterized protein